MKSEELKHKITIQRLTTTTNENGFVNEVWEDFKTVWAAITNLFGREYFAAASVQAENTVKFTIRYTPGISNDMQIYFNGNLYKIIHIDNIKYGNRYIEIKGTQIGIG
jgi:SPP1 family predicted phage head-tail adaptor